MKDKYVCPMHPEEVSDKPGRCSKCGMRLKETSNNKFQISNEQSSFTNNETEITKNSYMPLIVIVSLIAITSLTISLRNFSIESLISSFMIGFFLVFGGFKLIDLKGFAEGYSTYDLLAKRVEIYGFIYPFIEVLFGLAMILMPFSKNLLLAEIIVMVFSGIGVAIKLKKGEKFQCVCLGTVLKVPLTKVTLIEDFGMAILALMLFFL